MSAITPEKYSVETKKLSLQWAPFLGNFSRRTLDILASGFGLLFLSPVFLLVAIIIRRDSPGPIFYRGSRAGKYGREFGIFKFRTMYEDPASYEGPCVTSSDDGRITAFGRWLRDTKVNELPQLWNVLLGEMSLVGPRPEDFKIASEWPEEIRNEILSVRPGVTSPASIIFREEEKLLSSNNLMEDYLKKILPSKLRLDILYVRRRSLLNDLDVIFLTFIALLPLLRKKSIPENVLFYGPLNQFLSRFLNWFMIDWIVSSVAVIFSGIVWRLSAPLNVGVGYSLLLAFLIACVFSISNLVMQINRTSWHTARAEAAMDLGFSAFLALLVLLVVDHFAWNSVHLPSGMLVLVGILSFFGFVSVRYRERILTGIASRWFSLRGHTQVMGERVVIVGAGEMGALASWFLKHGEFSNAFSVVGFVDDDPRKPGMRVDGSPVVGMTSDLPSLIVKQDIGLVIFAISNIDSEQRRRILSICHRASVNLVMFPNVMGLIRSSLSPNTDLPAEWIERVSVAQMVDELHEIFEDGDLDRVHDRLHELQNQYTSQGFD